jgi:hypothetical protein
MRTSYRNHARGGHCPGHIRDMFLDAIDAYAEWQPGEPEPTVELEIHYQPHRISLQRACGLLWNCSDILPSIAYDTIEGTDLEALMRRRTYASAARAMHHRLAAGSGGIA